MADAVYLAERASRLREEITPYLAAMEKEAFEAALACDRSTPEGQAQANDFLRVVVVIRGLTGKLDIEILSGKHAAQNDGVRRVA